FRCVDVPSFSAAARMKTRILKLRSHCAVAEEDAPGDCFEKSHAVVLRKVQPFRSHRVHGFAVCLALKGTRARSEFFGFSIPDESISISGWSGLMYSKSSHCFSNGILPVPGL